MTRIIRVETCKECPSLDHRGAFGEIAYIPKCTATNETLPYTVYAFRGKPMASATYVIPDNCPLEKLP